jgi:hypothetical protein
LVVKTLLWRQHRRLEKAAFAEIEPGTTVLQSAADNDEGFAWRKEIYFGGLYQKVVATRLA